MRTRSSIVAVATALMMLWGGTPALAGYPQLIDPDDMTSPLDAVRVTLADRTGSSKTLTYVSDEGWRCTYLNNGLGKIRWYFDGRGDRSFDLVGRTKCRVFKGKRRVLLFLRGTGNTPNMYEPVPLRRPNRRTTKATFPFDLPELSGPHLEIVIRVADGQAEGCTAANPCRERAPDTGRWMPY